MGMWSTLPLAAESRKLPVYTGSGRNRAECSYPPEAIKAHRGVARSRLTPGPERDWLR
jgi:hypothetical protein